MQVSAEESKDKIENSDKMMQNRTNLMRELSKPQFENFTCEKTLGSIPKEKGILNP